MHTIIYGFSLVIKLMKIVKFIYELPIKLAPISKQSRGTFVTSWLISPTVIGKRIELHQISTEVAAKMK